MAKKKILLMSDDLRMHSGVATVSKDIVMETLNEYDWVQIGGAIQHPEKGKIVDMSRGLEEFGIKNGYLKIYPVDGYGNEDQLREVLEMEKPDAILHYTDPRFWIWFYNMEAEIRRTMPIFYYNIWDDLPDPQYNELYYRSCDLLMAISKQTYGINRRLLPDYEDWQITYVPHGISSRRFKKVDDEDVNLLEFNEEYDISDKKFKILYSNRNIRRKQPGDVLLAYKYFMDKLTPKQRDECVLIWHCQPCDDNGTDLPRVCRHLIPDYDVCFTYDRGGPMDDNKMNLLFNSADVYINIASNEGFGLGSAEALTVTTPIIVNVTGGMQDQCGFRNDDGELLTPEDYVELGSNHRGRYKNHGKWVKPVYPTSISLQGSPPTPYIWDDRCQPEDVAPLLREFYEMGREKRRKLGALGAKFCRENQMTATEMGQNFINSMNGAFENWKPCKPYEMIKV
jgi:glycosyltransferase involved in cell wall biosynthesis|tara:strand:+ start:2194 stop:3552 length:1359 start_codon:yes stop_codon:yes gene_type:complete